MRQFKQAWTRERLKAELKLLHRRKPKSISSLSTPRGQPKTPQGFGERLNTVSRKLGRSQAQPCWVLGSLKPFQAPEQIWALGELELNMNTTKLSSKSNESRLQKMLMRQKELGLSFSKKN